MASVARMIAVLLALPLASCSQAAGTAGEAPPPASSPVPAQAPEAASTAKGVILGKIVTHDAKVSILGGSPELRVVVRTHDGTLVADGVTLAELRAREPELYFVVTSAIAGTDPESPSQRTQYVDATLDSHHLN